MKALFHDISLSAVPTDREAALVTFLTTASGMSLFGLSAAFWGADLRHGRAPVAERAASGA